MLSVWKHNIYFLIQEWNDIANGFSSTRERLRCLFACYENTVAAEMKITDSVLRSFRVARTYRKDSKKINCVDFSPNGENAISSSNDDRIVLYDIREGK